MCSAGVTLLVFIDHYNVIQPSLLQLGSECLIIPRHHGWLQCSAMEHWEQPGLQLTCAYCSPGHTKVSRENKPESIPLANKVTAFKHSEIHRERVLNTRFCLLHFSLQDSVSHRALQGFHMFLSAQIALGFTFSKNLMCLSSLPELYLHPKSNFRTVSWREEFSTILMHAIK